MSRVLLVDDSSTIRAVVSKHLAELGLEVEHAEDGEQGLAKLAGASFNLILLDVTMPVMDGPTMLQRLREQGSTTPVIMLTSESKRSTVAATIRLGIDDYILKPFKAEELKFKVRKTLRMAVGVASAAAGVEGAPPAAAAAGTDVLVIDDMDNVHKKLAMLLPKHVHVHGCTTAADAIAKSQTKQFRVVILDLVIPGVNSIALMNQLRALQPNATMIALCLRSTHDVASDARAQGFADVLVKPFDPDALDEVVTRWLGGEVAACAENVITVAPFEGREDKLDRYYQRVRTACKESFETIASACFDDVVADLTGLPVRGDKLVRMVMELDREARKLGLGLRVVGAADHRRVLTSIADTAEVQVFDTVDQAREAA